MAPEEAAAINERSGVRPMNRTSKICKLTATHEADKTT